MNPSVIFLAIICIWPTENTVLPKIAFAQAPSLEVCQADAAIVKAKLEADPTVRFVTTECVEFDRGEKA